jgi:histidinol-phosphatase (PHP family)
MILSNYHTHSYFCDGKEAPEKYIKKAIDLGFSALGFSSHAPVPFENNYSIPPEKLNAYCSEIECLKNKYASEIPIFLALEADYIPKQSHNFSYFRENCPLDYLIGSVHLVAHPHSSELWFIDGGKSEKWDQGLKEIFGSDIQAGVKAFYHQSMQMIEVQHPDIIGHFDKIKMHNKNRYFLQTDAWYQNLIDESLQLIKEKDVVMEINTRGLYKGRSDELFPNIPILLKAQKMGIPLMLNSDAHRPDELMAYIPETIAVLKKNKIRELWHFTKKGWVSSPLD